LQYPFLIEVGADGSVIVPHQFIVAAAADVTEFPIGMDDFAGAVEDDHNRRFVEGEFEVGHFLIQGLNGQLLFFTYGDVVLNSQVVGNLSFLVINGLDAGPHPKGRAILPVFDQFFLGFLAPGELYRNAVGHFPAGFFTMQQIAPYLTARGDVFTVQVLGYTKETGPATRLEAMIDASKSPPMIVYQRDLTPLGKGFDRASWMNQEEVQP
jgi:hypothetical protein